MAQRGGHPHGRGRRQFRQPGGLGLEQRPASRVVDLDEIRPVAVADPPSLMNAPAADRLALTQGERLRRLNEIAIRQMRVLTSTNVTKKLKQDR